MESHKVDSYDVTIVDTADKVGVEKAHAQAREEAQKLVAEAGQFITVGMTPDVQNGTPKLRTTMVMAVNPDYVQPAAEILLLALDELQKYSPEDVALATMEHVMRKRERRSKTTFDPRMLRPTKPNHLH